MEGTAPEVMEDSKTSGDYAEIPKEERKEAWKKEKEEIELRQKPFIECYRGCWMSEK